MKNILLSSVCAVSVLAASVGFAAATGNVNIGLDASPSNQSFSFRLLVEGVSPTNETGCLSPGTGYRLVAGKEGIGKSTTWYKIQARNCVTGTGWQDVAGRTDYSEQYSYNVGCNLNNPVRCQFKN